MNARPLLRSTFLVLLTCAHAAGADTSIDAIDDAIAAAEYSHARQLVEAKLLEYPDDPSVLFRKARVQRYLGDPDGALQTLDELRQRYPYDVDYALARAQVLDSQGRDTEALDELRVATRLAPDYEDVWQLRHTLLLRQNNDVARLELETLSQEAAQRFPRARWWRVSDPENDADWSLLLGAGHDSLDNGSPSWQQQFIEVSRSSDTIGNYRIGIARDERYNESDLTVRVGGDVSFSSDWFAGFQISSASSPSFQPKFGYSASVGRSLGKGWVGNVGYRRREYDSVTVGSMNATVEKYIGDFRIAYVLGRSHLHGASNSLNHTATANWYIDDRSSIGLSMSTGEEAEAIGPGQVLQTEVRGLSLNGRRQLTDRFGLQWWLGIHDQGDIYRRRFLGLAVSIQL